MNYVAEVKAFDTENYSVAVSLAILFKNVLGDNDQGVLYWDNDGHCHYE